MVSIETPFCSTHRFHQSVQRALSLLQTQPIHNTLRACTQIILRGEGGAGSELHNHGEGAPATCGQNEDFFAKKTTRYAIVS